jgi:hypothetical protein
MFLTAKAQKKQRIMLFLFAILCASAVKILEPLRRKESQRIISLDFFSVPQR